MGPLRVGYVREHFSSPLLQFAEADQGKTFTLVECPSGTGQLISRLTNNEIDVAIALTDALVSGIAKGSKAYKLVGSYVNSPLNWAVITGNSSSFNSIADLKDTTIGISRHGSGSQTMAFVMALQQGWSPTTLKFQVNNDIKGLISSVNDSSTSAFMWEWFTTKPWLDSGEVRFIGSVPTPWSSWLIAAHPSAERAPKEAVRSFLNSLTVYVATFDSKESRDSKNVPFVQKTWGYPEADIKEWMSTVKYTTDCTTISSAVLSEVLRILSTAGFITSPEGVVHPSAKPIGPLCAL
ncbi:periplasmic binding protein-like II [Thelephora terrestris]|uniref:Periplasmic binding protein-like II n=1 Tax=Thelephora terrestris TaxID=56493 RepID=A0A9P6HI67_9AGAM|nr:periplasmic binding protein-like II [Thelephora terrestris]